MSSRNAYLTPAERSSAPRLHEALRAVQAAFRAGERSAQRLFVLGAGHIAADQHLQLEYMGVADPRTLQARHDDARPGDRILIAVRLGQTRLIDNEEL
jgi:pantoate--beta-alanine ligase